MLEVEKQDAYTRRYADTGNSVMLMLALDAIQMKPTPPPDLIEP